MLLGIKKIGFLYDEYYGLDGVTHFVETTPKGQKIKDYDPQGYLPLKGKKYMSNSSKFFCNLSYQCLDSFQIGAKDRVGIYNCTDMPHLEDSVTFVNESRAFGVSGVSPILAPSILANVCSGQMAISSGINGINFTMTSGANSVPNGLQILNLHIQEEFVDYGIIVSMEVASHSHNALRANRKSNSPEFGGAILVGKYDPSDIAKISYSKTVNIKPVESGLSSLLESGFADVDLIIVDSGTTTPDNQGVEKVIRNYYSSPIVYLEDISGKCDNSGNILAILYSIKAFVTNDIKRVLLLSIDESGSTSLSLIEK